MLAAAVSLPVAATAPVAGARTGSAPAGAHQPKRSGASASAASRIVTTVTKIIDVVPGSLRIVIAALLALALAFAVHSRLAARRARLLARQRGELLEDVGLLQAALLPAPPEELDGVLASSAYRPASGPAAGGDFYDLFALEDGRVVVIVGDVSGHGRRALPHTTLVRFTLRAYLEAGMSPRGALQAAAPVLERQLEHSFATVVAAVYDPAHRLLTYACAGHPPPAVVHAGGRAPTPITACSAPPIGVGWPTGTRQTVLSLPGEARVCFYTDGVTEARVQGELYGTERLRVVLEGLAQDDGAEQVLERVARESDERPDDMAACVLSLPGAARPAAVAVEEVEIHRHELGGRRLERFLAAVGVPPGQVEPVLARARDALGREGRVVLRVRPAEAGGRPEIELAHDNVARMRITARALADPTEVAV